MSEPSTRMGMSYLEGPALESDPDILAWTTPAFLRAVCARYAEREAVAFVHPRDTVRWTYAELWDRTEDVARALVAAGVGKGTRVGVLMSNRPELIAAIFASGLVGAVAVPITTFATADELEYMLGLAGVSHLLLERRVAKKDFADMMRAIVPEASLSAPMPLTSVRLPHLRRLIAVDLEGEDGAIEGWSRFLAAGQTISAELVAAMTESVSPGDLATILFSSGSTSRPRACFRTTRQWRSSCAVGRDSTGSLASCVAGARTAISGRDPSPWSWAERCGAAARWLCRASSTRPPRWP